MCIYTKCFFILRNKVYVTLLLYVIHKIIIKTNNFYYTVLWNSRIKKSLLGHGGIGGEICIGSGKEMCWCFGAME